ncbi:MAG TPA: ATP-binding protein [Polyangia bacterium]|nr:ATP-binding protein [Polyangia bacterium]
MAEPAAHPPLDCSLTTFARELCRIDDYDGLVELVRRELGGRLGLTNAWLYVFERADDEQALLVAAAGPKAALIRDELPVAPTAGDWLITALRRNEAPVVIPDARDLAENPEVARRLDNRTVVNVPIAMVDRTLGILGGGTFGDEGAVPVDEGVIAYLLHLGNLASMAIARFVLRAHDEDRARLEAELAQRRRLESLGLLAGGVAHDFRNLFTVIRASAGFIAAEPLSEAQRRDLGVIVEAERSASELTGKLLMLGRDQPPSFVVAEINDVVTGCLQRLQRALPAESRITFTGAEGLPPLRLDPRQLEQVLMNMALNARDAMSADGHLVLATQAVTIDDGDRRAHPVAQGGSYVRLTVADNGCGMSPEVVERAFEPFFTTKPQGEGTGLGLAVSWGVVQQHGGFIHCASEVGAGTTFEIYLPVVEQLAPELPPPDEASAPGGTERILFADDQPYLLDIVARVLSRAGYSVVAVANGAAAVAAAARENFDLHVLDAIMPVMSGREACERIRAARPEAQFLFISGFSGAALPVSFLADLGIRVLPKPFDAATLLREVRATLDAAAGQTTASVTR